MKKLFYIFSICCSLIFISCEEEIILDFNETVPRLVIEGNFFVDEDSYNKIHLSTTTDFYSNVFPTVDDAQVMVKNVTNNEEYLFENIGNGDFYNSDFLPEIGNNYELTVIYKEEIYTAASTFWDAPEIINIEQKDDGGIDGNTYEFRFYFQDNPDEENYYLVQIITPYEYSLGVLSDEFTNGNLMDDLYFFYKDDLKSGDQLHYSINNISKEYYNYLSKLLSISGNWSNPFASPMGTLKGNIINQTNEDNYALGYFHIAKRNHYIYVVE